jgi:orotidine-5'-phosphate decarboxylase
VADTLRRNPIILPLDTPDPDRAIDGVRTLSGSVGAFKIGLELGLEGCLASNAVRLAALAEQAGLDDVVSSPHEAVAIRCECGPDFLIITPGIRPAGAAVGDQRRVATPAEALSAGADYQVVSRALTGGADPRASAQALLAEALAA